MKRTIVFRTIAMILALLIAMSLAGCDKGTVPTKPNETTLSVSQKPTTALGDDITSVSTIIWMPHITSLMII
mgnify:CR=1 FL=1